MTDLLSWVENIIEDRKKLDTHTSRMQESSSTEASLTAGDTTRNTIENGEKTGKETGKEREKEREKEIEIEIEMEIENEYKSATHSVTTCTANEQKNGEHPYVQYTLEHVQASTNAGSTDIGNVTVVTYKIPTDM